MRELAVIFQKQERVFGRANQHIQIRRHARQEPQQSSGDDLTPVGDRLRERSAQGALG